MKKVLAILILIGLVLPIASLAGIIRIENPLEADTFAELIGNIIDFIFTIALFIAPLMIMIGAFYFLTAVEDVQKVETGKKIILYTIIGFVIIMLSRGLVELLRQAFLEN